MSHDDPLDFARRVPHDGYAWWYLDALSADKRYGLVIIAFIGSVFSPYYAYARRRTQADPERYCAVNVALYGVGQRWAMTERSAHQVTRDTGCLRIGPSSLQRTEDGIDIQLEERCAPWPRALRGMVRVRGITRPLAPRALDTAGEHLWQPIAPTVRVEVDMREPALRWTGHGYLDSNRGDVPLERSFEGWHWSRTHRPDGSSTLMYDVDARDGGGALLGIEIDRAGNAFDVTPAPRRELPRSRWGLSRVARVTADCAVGVSQTLEDTPFYARSELWTKQGDTTCTTVHETLSMRRFTAPWVQCMLPFRMPRITW